MRLQLIPAGAGQITGAKVINRDTGAEVENLLSVSYRHDAGQVPRLIIEVASPDLIPLITGPVVVNSLDAEIKAVSGWVSTMSDIYPPPGVPVEAVAIPGYTTSDRDPRFRIIVERSRDSDWRDIFGTTVGHYILYWRYLTPAP